MQLLIAQIKPYLSVNCSLVRKTV